MNLIPTRMEIDNGDSVLAVVKMFDEGGSSVRIKTLVNPEVWPELSDKIFQALKKMHPEKEGEKT